MNSVLQDILSIVLFWLAIILLFVGIGFMAIPAKLLELTTRLNKWVATDSLFNGLNRSFSFERIIYRHHTISGLIIIVCCIYVFLRIWLCFEVAIEILPVIINATISQWLYTALVLLIFIADIVVFIIGLIILVRPSILKGIESWSNRWIDSEKALKNLDKEYELKIEWFPKYPRVFGLFIVLGCLYIISNMGPLSDAMMK